MQAFDFAKQLLMQLRNYKSQHGDIVGSKNQPARMQLKFEPEYDEQKANPLRELHLTCTCGDIVREYVLDVPKEALLRREKDIGDWLFSVLDFAANAQAMALRQVEKKAQKQDLDLPDTRVFIQPDRWEINWVINEGALSQCPVDAVGVQMDKLQKRCMDGWWQADGTPPVMQKNIRSLRRAEEIKELLHLLLEINGHADKDVRKDIVIEPSEQEGFRISMPKRHYELIMSAEQYLGM